LAIIRAATLVRVFDVAPNGTIERQTDRIFADLRGPEPGGPDGMKVDTAGNVYCATGNASRCGSAGIYILDPKAKKLGHIVRGYPETTNIAFGGDDWKTLYFTARNTLASVNLKIAGLPVPTPKK
jgi:gluconolactonase